MKRNISEIFDNLTPDTSKIMSQYGIETKVDEVTKRRIYNSVMSEINARKSEMPETNKKPLPVRKKFNKVAIIAAACIAAMTIGGISAGADTLYKKFTDYKPAYTEVQKATINEARFPINKQASFEGITFTVTEGMRDERMLYLLINAECDPEITGSTKDKVIYIYTESSVGGSIRSEILEHEGDTYTLLIAYDTGGIGIEDNQQIDITFDGVSLYIPAIDPGTGGKIRCEDLWTPGADAFDSISFTVNDQKANFGKQFYTDEQISFMGVQTDIGLGYISPWYGTFDLYNKGEDYDAMEIDNGTPYMKITMNDGKVYTTDDGINIFNDFYTKGSGNKHKDGYTCRWQIYMTFDEYIDTVNIESIEINGVKMGIENIDLSKEFTALDYYWLGNY